MSVVRIALANIRVPPTPEDSVRLAMSAVADAGRRGVAVICFPECFVTGYRWPNTSAPSPDPAFLERAWTAVADAARTARVAVILGTERMTTWAAAELALRGRGPPPVPRRIGLVLAG